MVKSENIYNLFVGEKIRLKGVSSAVQWFVLVVGIVVVLVSWLVGWLVKEQIKRCSGIFN